MRYSDARLIFEAEPRDEGWAQQRESAITDATINEFKRVDPEARMEVECRTGTCRVRVHSRNPHLSHKMGFYPLQCLAQFAQPEWGPSVTDAPDVEDAFSDYYLMFGSTTRSSEGFGDRTRTLCPKYRDAWFKKASARE